MTGSPRVSAVLLDHLDSFSNNVADGLYQSGFEPVIVPVAPDRQGAGDGPVPGADLANCHALVLSPGPGHPRDYNTAALRRYLRQVRPDLPVLGICLGLQMLLDWDDLPVEPLSAPGCPAVHGRVKPMGPSRFVLPHPFDNLQASAGMVFYNSLAVRWTSAAAAGGKDWNLVPSDDEEAFVTMAVHRSLPWMGVQFHPESFASLEGAAVFEAFARFCREQRARRLEQGGDACLAASTLSPL